MMNQLMIKRLILKDWQFNISTIVLYISIGVVALTMVSLGGQTVFYMGSVLFIAVLMGLGIHLAIATVMSERNDQTLAFIMSLPVTIMDFTIAKILANLLVFLVPWLSLTIASVFIITGREALPNGMIPFVIVVVSELFVAYCLVLAVALITESDGWTIGAIVICNLFFNYFLYFFSHLELVEANMNGAEPVWSLPIWSTLAILAICFVMIMVMTFFFQGRKKDFL